MQIFVTMQGPDQCECVYLRIVSPSRVQFDTSRERLLIDGNLLCTIVMSTQNQHRKGCAFNQAMQRISKLTHDGWVFEITRF